MNWFTGVCIYLTIWWTVIFAILPLGTRTHAEMGVTPPPGCDPGAPVNPNLWRKAITTTWVSAILFAALWAVIAFHLVTLPELNGGHWFR